MGMRYKKRFQVYLQVGTFALLPLRIHLHDRKNFTEEDYEELLRMVSKHVVGKYIRRVRIAGQIVASPRTGSKKEQKDFADRCSPFKRSSCLGAKLRFGYYFHSHPYSQPAVLAAAPPPAVISLLGMDDKEATVKQRGREESNVGYVDVLGLEDVEKENDAADTNVADRAGDPESPPTTSVVVNQEAPEKPNGHSDNRMEEGQNKEEKVEMERETEEKEERAANEEISELSVQESAVVEEQQYKEQYDVLPYTLMVFTRSISMGALGQATVGGAAKKRATPPIKISEYFAGSKMVPKKRRRSPGAGSRKKAKKS